MKARPCVSVLICFSLASTALFYFSVPSRPKRKSFPVLIPPPPAPKAGYTPHPICARGLASTVNSQRVYADGTEPGYNVDFWGVVRIAPVPAFHINTHDPEKQDVFISGSVHAGKDPWDPYVWELFVRVLSEADGLVVDVGANIGYFTLMAAAMGHRVVAFEPMNRNAAKLQSSIARNGFQRQVVLYHNAASFESSGKVSLTETHHTNQGNGQMRSARADVSGVYGVDYSETVTLDDAIHEDVLLLKIDVEGFESAVLDGAQRLVCEFTVRFITIEFSETTAKNQLCPVERMLNFFESLGYTISDIVPHAPTLSASEFHRFPPNILFTLQDKARKRNRCSH